MANMRVSTGGSSKLDTIKAFVDKANRYQMEQLASQQQDMQTCTIEQAELNAHGANNYKNAFDDAQPTQSTPGGPINIHVNHFAQQNDPRVTRVGRIIRKLRIDELPQTWTVLKGEMSFVGPRPERPEFVADLEDKLPYYAERHMVKPGITGWAQINYPYGASIEDSRHKLEYDLYYAKNYTPFLDLLILLQTLRVVLWHEGAR